MAWFTGLSLLARVGIFVAALGVVGVSYKLWEAKIFKDGRDYQTNLMAAQDREATNAADAAADRFRACRDAGGLWRPATGNCEKR